MASKIQFLVLCALRAQGWEINCWFTDSGLGLRSTNKVQEPVSPNASTVQRVRVSILLGVCRFFTVEFRIVIQMLGVMV